MPNSSLHPMTRVVLCLDKLKGSLTAAQACDALAVGLRSAAPGVTVLTRPVADGGEGTVDALWAAGWSWVPAAAHDPLGRPLRAGFVVRDGVAVVEMALASGLGLLTVPEPVRASTRGTGELVAAALEHGCREVVLAVGGSATTDGGVGMLQALGAHFRTADGAEVGPGELGAIATADLSGVDPRLGAVRLVLASDVESPLLGPAGAAVVYGPQKGADAAQVVALEAGLTRLADALALATGVDHRDSPGAGSAGGTGFAALVLGAVRTSGADLVLTETGLATDLTGADLVVVGEGRLDAQSLAGKAPVRVAALAAAQGVAVVAVAGQVTVDGAQLRAHGIGRAHQLLDHAPDVATAVARAAQLLAEVGAVIGRELPG